MEEENEKQSDHNPKNNVMASEGNILGLEEKEEDI